MAIINGNTLSNFLPGTNVADSIFARGGNDILLGNGGNDLLNGGTGNDLLNGGAGIDTASYSNGVSGGQIFIGATAGVTVNLTLAGAQNTGGGGIDTLIGIENVTGTNFNDALTGNGGNNVLSGLGGNDFLSGLAGNDQLNGGFGNDSLNGGTGNDLLTGGAGRDVLTGGGGALAFDTFDYNAASDSLPGVANRDVITDFQGNGVFAGDRIDLSTIDANAFLLGNQAFTAAQLTYVGGVLSANIIGTAPAPDLQIQLVGAPALVLSDIVL
jgi:Ca2+-binding RTX toxin-like protein